MTDRSGQLWESGSLRYLVIKCVPSKERPGFAWLALQLHDYPDPLHDCLTACLAEEFFTHQEWWEQVA